jgi:anionic cell wall polymer biosynthesis LytR-Cps2A-Psr (LCP) family protein
MDRLKPACKDILMKNLILLAFLTWVTVAYAAGPVAQETLHDAESYKVEKPVQEQDAQRSLAGSKSKKKKKDFSGETLKQETPGEEETEIKFWKYTEE